MGRRVSANSPRNARAHNWSEHPAQTPVKLTELTVKKRRRENLLLIFFNCFAAKLVCSSLHPTQCFRRGKDNSPWRATEKLDDFD